MLCTKCGKNEATVYFSQNINGNKTEYNLCPQCAREMDITRCFERHRQYVASKFYEPIGSFGFPFESFFEVPSLSLFDFPSEKSRLSDKGDFSAPTEPPKPTEDKLTTLKRQLDEAVKAERYEDAAKFRDEIRAMEK